MTASLARVLSLASVCSALACGQTLGLFPTDGAVGTDSVVNPTDVQVIPSDTPVILTDVTPTDPDNGLPVEAGVDARVPRCGDGFLDPGESCDDTNNRGGDGCSATCRFEARCGDGRTDAGETCDDGNNMSGDGCRSDCRSNETCGNGIVDTARGEVCDGTAGCGRDCRTISTCGNNTIDTGEQCDDGNTTRWDGCAPDCTVEQGMALDRLLFAANNGRGGCDFSGDGRPDNAFVGALGGGTINPIGILNAAANGSISDGRVLLQLSFLAMNDLLGQNDDDLRLGFTNGRDGDTDSRNNLDPLNPQKIARTTLNTMTLMPQAQFQSRLAMGDLAGGPEDILMNLPGPMGFDFSFRMKRARIFGRVNTQMHDGRQRMWTLTEGTLCGAIPATDLSRLRNFFAFSIPGLGGGGTGGRDSGTNPAMQSSMLEAIAAGYNVTVPILNYTLRVGPAQPDVDLDGDGLEQFIGTGGDFRNAPRITACVDGNGTRIEGGDCVRDPRMADGYSNGFTISGVAIRFVGIGD